MLMNVAAVNRTTLYSCPFHMHVISLLFRDVLVGFMTTSVIKITLCFLLYHSAPAFARKCEIIKPKRELQTSNNPIKEYAN
jgi:hypothetical protein